MIGIGIGIGIDSAGAAAAAPAGPVNLVTNGTFDSGANWTLAGTNSTISSGTWNAGGGGGAKTATQTSATALVQDDFYSTSLQVTARTLGFVTLSVGGTAGSSRLAVGTYTQIIKAGAAQTFVLTGNSGANLSVDNVAVYASTGLGPELIPGGDMASDTGWTLDPGITIAGGVMTATADGVATYTATEASVVGQAYRMTAEIVTWASGIVDIAFGGGTGATGGAVSSLSGTNVASAASDTLTITFSGGADMALDLVSVKKLLFS